MFDIALPNGSWQKTLLDAFVSEGTPIPPLTRAHWQKINIYPVSRIVWMRPQHVPLAVLSGMVHLGITGSDCYEEWRLGSQFTNLQQVGQGLACGLVGGQRKVCLVGAEEDQEQADFDIFSEFPLLTRARSITASSATLIQPSVGSVEAMIPRPFRFGVTVVQTGASLEANRLRIVEILMDVSLNLCVRDDCGQRYWEYNEFYERLQRASLKLLERTRMKQQKLV